MNFPFFIAKRYFLSKKSTNAINIISFVAMTGITVGSMALIIVLSVFNGFENLVVSLMNSFNPDFQITITEGKTFDPGLIDLKKIQKLEGVVDYAEVLEENALLRYLDKQYIATIKGVSDNYLNITRFDTVLVAGEPVLKEDEINYGLLGYGIYNALSISNRDEFNPITVSIPSNDFDLTTVNFNPEKAFNKDIIYPGGIFSIQQSIDEKYMIVPISFIKKLLGLNTGISSIEIIASANSNFKKLQKQIQAIAGDQFNVKNRYEQNPLLYKVMNAEKWAVYAILTFILIIAAFNIIGSLTMLIVEKKKDISILHSMGANPVQIRTIFLMEGLFISFFGLILGFLLSISLLLFQQKFGFIKLEGISSFIIDAYPVKMKFMDFILVFGTVLVIGITASWFPAKKSSQNITLSSTV